MDVKAIKYLSKLVDYKINLKKTFNEGVQLQRECQIII